MVWLTLAALGVCAVLFYLAAEHAAELREGSNVSRFTLFGAAASFVLAVILLDQAPPAEGFPRVLGIALPAVSGLACFWFCKGHVDLRKPVAAFLSAILGLALCGMAILVLVSEAPPPGPDDPLVAENGEDAGGDDIDRRLKRFGQRRRALEMRLQQKIPEFRRHLDGQVTEIKIELGRASEATKPTLEEEIREIARLLLAVEREEQETRDLIVRIGQEQRRLERLRESRAVLGDDEALVGELDRVWQEAGAQLSRPIDERLGAGAIARTEVDRKLAELMGD
jgi:hypothetical protein